MQWLLDNWILVLLGGGMIAMHLFGHGHGHGSHGSKKGDDTPADTDAGAESVQATDRSRDTYRPVVKTERNRDL
jgi:hypothetical protein